IVTFRLKSVSHFRDRAEWREVFAILLHQLEVKIRRSEIDAPLAAEIASTCVVGGSLFVKTAVRFTFFLSLFLPSCDLAKFASVVPKFLLRHDQNAIIISPNVPFGGFNKIAHVFRGFLSAGFCSVVRKQFLKRLTQLDKPNQIPRAFLWIRATTKNRYGRG